MSKEKKQKDNAPGGVFLAAAHVAQTQFAENALDNSLRVQEMFELLMLSDIANDRDVREQAYIAMVELRECAPYLEELHKQIIVANV